MKGVRLLISLFILTSCATEHVYNNIRVMEELNVVCYIPRVNVVEHNENYTEVKYEKGDSIYTIVSDLVVVETIKLTTKKLPCGKTEIKYLCYETPGYRTWKYKKILKKNGK